jgi:hypothetical protein
MRRLLPLAALLLGSVTSAGADVSSEARTPGEIYERRASIRDCLVYVAKDLRVRFDAKPADGPACLLLVVDATTGLRDELEVLREALPAAVEAGPPGLRIGVVGAAANATPPSPVRGVAASALGELAFLPVDGPKNGHHWIREGAKVLARETSRGPKALLFVSEAGDDEDDVEATRDALVASGAAFYALAPEAGFERAWLQDFAAPRDHPAQGLAERWHPAPRRREEGELYYGSEVALGLVPYGWEFDFAQADFVWVRPPRYPVPSGFGYWSLATLAFTTGGRYFLHDFTRAPERGSTIGRPDPRTLLYDYSRLGQLAPDLRPRSRVLRDLSKDPRAEAIVRIWAHLADEACPIVQALGTLEPTGASLSMRPARPVRSQANPLAWYEDLDDVREAQSLVAQRLVAVETALKWWASANAKERPPRDQQTPLTERIEADFGLLGLQLLKVRFHWQAVRAALDEIKPLHVTERRVRLRAFPLATGTAKTRAVDEMKDEGLRASFAEAWAAQVALRERYVATPWALVVEKGWWSGFTIDVQVLEPAPERPPPPQERGKPAPGAEEPRPTPPPPPPAGPRPGSTAGGPTTGR